MAHFIKYLTFCELLHNVYITPNNCGFSDLNDDTKTSQTVDESLEETLKTRGKKKKIVADAILPEVNLDQVPIFETYLPILPTYSA